MLRMRSAATIAAQHNGSAAASNRRIFITIPLCSH
jgi:hypothetical protein